MNAEIVIEEQETLRVAKKKEEGFKSYYQTVIVSIVLHLFIALFLFYFSEQQQLKQVKIPKEVIKSYLYKVPIKPVIKAVIKEEIEKVEQLIAHEQVSQPELESKNTEKATDVVTSSKATAEQFKPKGATVPKKEIQASFSSYKQLDNLRNTINKQIMAQELTEQQQFRSPSVMHGEQIPVPHSSQQLTPAQEMEKKTTRMSDNISITKYDNGLCTIEREQFLGSPVEGSSAAFACGESKFDKSFREHMKKVQAKYLPVNVKKNE